MYRINSLEQLEQKGSGTGVFLPRVSVSRPVKWAAAGSDGAFKNLDAASHPSRLDQGSQPRQETTESAANALVSEVLPVLTPVSSPTAGAVGVDIPNIKLHCYTNIGAMQLSKGAPSEGHSSSSWGDQLSCSAAPEVGGWSIRRTSSTARGSSASQQPPSRAHMRQLLQQHQQMQQAQ